MGWCVCEQAEVGKNFFIILLFQSLCVQILVEERESHLHCCPCVHVCMCAQVSEFIVIVELKTSDEPSSCYCLTASSWSSYRVRVRVCAFIECIEIYKPCAQHCLVNTISIIVSSFIVHN